MGLSDTAGKDGVCVFRIIDRDAALGGGIVAVGKVEALMSSCGAEELSLWMVEGVGDSCVLLLLWTIKGVGDFCVPLSLWTIKGVSDSGVLLLLWTIKAVGDSGALSLP
jgi:hypothetical protein